MMPLLRKLKMRSIRTRLMIWNVCTLALILAMMGAVIKYSVGRSLMASVDSDLKAKATAMETHRRPFEHRPPSGPPPGMPMDGGLMPGLHLFGMGDMGPHDHHGLDGPGGPGRADNNTRDPYRPVMISLPNQNRPDPFAQAPIDLAGYRMAQRGKDVHRTVTIDGELVRVLSSPLRHRDTVTGVIQVPYPLGDLNRAVDGIGRLLWMLAPVALVLAAVGGALLTDRALRPVRRVVATTEQIGAQDLSHRLEVVGADEFSHLATTINSMLNRLETAFGQKEALVKRLERLVEKERRFTADASHELKTPLTVVRANASLLREPGLSEEDRCEMIDDIYHASGAMSDLIQDLLYLARSDESQLGKRREPTSVQEILDAGSRMGCARRRTDLALTLSDPDLAVLGNSDELARLFANLIKNACQYSPEGAEIRVSALERDGKVEIRVEDSGPGIAPEHLKYLGERFYRVSASRSRPDGGTGLGLSICRGIVEAHGGEMRFESTVGVGTTVIVTLPGAAAAFLARINLLVDPLEEEAPIYELAGCEEA